MIEQLGYRVQRAGSANEALELAGSMQFDMVISDIVMAGYDRAKVIIGQHRMAVELMAQTLLEQESIDQDEIREIMQRANALL